MLLSNEDKRKFIEFLEQEIQSNKVLLEQADKLSIKPMITKLASEIAALGIVLKNLQNTESVTISNTGV